MRTPHRVIDVHAHAVLEAGFGAAGRHGPELIVDSRGSSSFRVGEFRMSIVYRGTVFMDVDRRLELMDDLGIDLQLLSPNPLTFFHGIEPDLALRFCRVHNDAMAELVARHPDRLLGAAALPMQDPDAAARELQRAVRELGLVAAYVGTDYPFPLDDPCLDDLYRTFVALDVPLFLHPSSTGGEAMPADPRLHRFNLDLIVGYAYDESPRSGLAGLRRRTGTPSGPRHLHLPRRGAPCRFCSGGTKASPGTGTGRRSPFGRTASGTRCASSGSMRTSRDRERSTS